MIYLIGIGPGDSSLLTPEARSALQDASCVIGYERYINLLKPVLNGQTLEPYPIGKEEQRARRAVEVSDQGKTVALVSSGDASIYGMGAALFEVLDHSGLTDLNVKVCPGVSSLNATSALLGAPLGQDFASISLSDLLTPWKTIETRVKHAAAGDFVLVFYNPRSDTRQKQLPRALEIISEYRTGSTPVALVRNAYREGQAQAVHPLESFPVEQVDMLTTVVVGNSQTRHFGNWVYTPRGYLTGVNKCE